jgi:hypothetical protein
LDATLSERFSVFDQYAGPLRGRPGLRRSISFDMEERSYERDLQLDFLST